MSTPITSSKKSHSFDKMQRFNQYTGHLPNLDKLKANAYQDFKEIKYNLTKSIVLNELRPGLMHWTTRLQTYINEYGICFKKKDQINLIELYLQILYTPDIDFVIVSICLTILVELLKKIQLLSRDDLKIDWKPIYKLYLRISNVDDRSTELTPSNLEQVTFVNFVCYARVYFDVSATREMLTEWRPLMCPFDMSMSKAFELYDLFLPTLLKESEIDQGFKLWLEEFLELWLTSSATRSYWESSFMSLLSRVAAENIGLFNWTPYTPYIFSKLLRGFGLSLSNEDTLNINDGTPKETAQIINGFSAKFALTNTDIYHLSKLIVSLIGCGPDRDYCMRHIFVIFKLLRSYYYPSNTDVPMENFYALLESFPTELIERMRYEKSDKYMQIKTKSTVEANSIREEDTEALVTCLKDIVLTAIFSKTHFNDAIKTYQYLCFIRPDIMLPPLLEKISSSFHVLIETHRYTPMLACLVSVPRELAIFRSSMDDRMQLNTIDLLCAILPGIDINDLNKFILTNQLLANVFSCISICDCSPALDVRTDLSEDEKVLCMQTAKFEDFVLELLKRLFDFIDNLANDSTTDNMDTAKNDLLSRNLQEITEENVIQSHLLQMLKTLASQSSKKILKLIVKKLQAFMRDKSFNFRAGSILASFCSYLVNSIYSEAFDVFFNNLYDTLREFKDSQQYKNFLINERGERTVTWNLQLLSHLLEANGLLILKNITRIKDIIKWFKNLINMECIGHLTNCFNHLIVSLTSITTVEISSFNDFTLDDEADSFFANHLPIRHWGSYISLNELNVKYHIPSSGEVKAAIEITNTALNESIGFLNRSLVLKNENIKKEENYRELNYIYHVLFGSSRILMRGSHKFITDHLRTKVDIGVADDLNKGLGFEKCTLIDNDHKFTAEELNAVQNLRDQLTQFILKLADNLIKENSSDTVLMILIARILATASMTYGWFADDFKKSWESHFITKATIQNKLINKKYPRDELIRRINLQYNYRSFHIHTRLNEQDMKIIDVLSNLSINSAYDIVRKEARTNLYLILSQYPYSTLTLVSKLNKYLEKNNNEKTKLNKDQIEGCLLLLNGNSKQSSFLLKQNWDVVAQIWPALFKWKFFEKENTSRILDAIYERTNDTYESFDNNTKINPSAIINAFLICPLLATTYRDDRDELRLQIFNKNLASDKKNILNVMQSLISIANDEKMVLKNQRISLFSIIYLLNPCRIHPELLTAECVKLFVDSLVHENVTFRQMSIDGLCIILKMIKHKKQTRRLKVLDLISKETNGLVSKDGQVLVDVARPGYREDNLWHLYDPTFISCAELKGPDADKDISKWEATNFLDKSYWGYYCWPTEVPVNSNKRDTFNKKSEDSSNSYKHVIKPILKRFHKDADFVEKFVKYSTIEESKGNELFDKKRFHMFKALFRNFGSTDIINGLFKHLNRLVNDREQETHESNHKLAAELIAGLIRGSKYWPLGQLKVMWMELKEILDIAIKNISSTTLVIWLSCLSTSFEDQDPRRMTFYLNYFQEVFLSVLVDLKLNSIENPKKSSFESTNTLQLLSAFTQFEWRIPLFWAKLSTPLQENMSSTNKTVREIVPACLAYATKSYQEVSISLGNSNRARIAARPARYVSIDDSTFTRFIDYLVGRLQEAFELFEILGDKSNDERKKEIQRGRINEFISNLNFVQSTINWLYYHVPSSSQPFNTQVLRIIEKLSKVDKVASYEDLIKIKLLAIRAFIPILSLDENCIKPVVEILKEISKSSNWRTRLCSIHIIQNFGVFNIFLLDEELKTSLKNVVIESLVDDELRVRLASCVALTSLIHSDFIQTDVQLIKRFKTLSSVKIKKKIEGSESIEAAKEVTTKHGGILGLCAIVNASPYDVPDYLPDIVSYLCHFTNDQTHIQDSVKKCLSEFKRTHQDNWQANKLKFTEDQLNMLSETSVSQNYYA